MESFEQLAEKYSPMIHAIINKLHIYKNKQEFYQVGLIALWEAQRNFQPEKGAFASYAYSFIKGRMLTELSNSRKWEEAASTLLVETNAGFSEFPANDEPFEKEILLSYCKTLTSKQKFWVIASFYDGLTTKEIAHKASVSESAVKKWKKGALEKLKQQFNPETKTEIKNSRGNRF
ncbi:MULTISPECIES: sigma-70 family RNA polymerase sigma factor [Bacillus]|uniref:sigma-70 family RNA polymerase sigma factor n=1 Tax=Bacillus TaxID=1386 RepID=UPI00065E73A1|nr:sigma-70 family RNA polymerase sigma factor [Bacillus smithii]AKP48377.1 RNA polymerase sigma factor [Bacillus smithii]